MRFLYRTIIFLSIIGLNSCMKWDYGVEISEFDVAQNGLFILNEGNFQYGNSSLSFYIPETDSVLNEIFYRANGMKLGDVAQSMTIHNGLGWITVNNSHVVFAIDPVSFKEIGRIENLPSPRYIQFVNDEKAYISQIWDNRIFIVNPLKYKITGHIDVPDMTMESGSTEQMVMIGQYVYCTCWSYQNRIIKIDTVTDEIVEDLIVGIQPKSLVYDKYGRLWTITDGGYEGSPYGYEPPALCCIDPEKMSIEKKFTFPQDSSPLSLVINGDGDTLYWVNGDVWKMSIDSDRFPVVPVIQNHDTKYYGLTINPDNGEIYVADAIDYQQQGMIYRYSKSGEMLDMFYTGVTPGAFCWK